MIDDADARLTTWVKSVLTDGADVSLGAPSAEAAGARPRVGLYLFALAEASPGHRDARRFHDLVARYLVTTHAGRPEDEHKLLGALLAAAVQEGKEIDVAPLPADTWRAFGLAPRPCFVVEENVAIERPFEKVPIVRQPLIVRDVPLATLQGRVLGPRDIPIASAVVEHLGIGQVTTTDADGRFRFPLVQAQGRPHQLEVEAKGTRQAFTIPAGANAPVALQLQITEG
jgi:hypothetical protein